MRMRAESFALANKSFNKDLLISIIAGLFCSLWPKEVAHKLYYSVQHFLVSSFIALRAFQVSGDLEGFKFQSLVLVSSFMYPT